MYFTLIKTIEYLEFVLNTDIISDFYPKIQKNTHTDFGKMEPEVKQ